MSVRDIMTAFFHGFTFGSIPGDTPIPGLPTRLFAEEPQELPLNFTSTVEADSRSNHFHLW